MRCDLLVGLSVRAKNLIRGARRETIGHIPGAYKPWVGALRRYTRSDGAVLVEFVQSAPWCCGPNYYLALKTADGEVLAASLWTRDEMC
jgi:hypothetical protein